MLFNTLSPHVKAVLQALFVTFLWSTSWVLIKIGLNDDIPPLIFAGLRYTIAFICLLAVVLRYPTYLQPLRTLKSGQWLQMIALGLLLYSVAQGAQFVGLQLLPSITVNLLLSLSAVVVTGLGLWLLREYPTRTQWFGLLAYLIGIVIYFYPFDLPDLGGIIVVLLGMLAASVAAILSRALNRDGIIPPLTLTTVSMGIGAISLLSVGIITQGGLPVISLQGWLIIVWMAVVNTAFAFTLWNVTLKVLSAMESSLINNLMMVQIPILALLFLDEEITLKVLIGLTFAAIGIIIVQMRRLPWRNPPAR